MPKKRHRNYVEINPSHEELFSTHVEIHGASSGATGLSKSSPSVPSKLMRIFAKETNSTGFASHSEAHGSMRVALCVLPGR